MATNVTTTRLEIIAKRLAQSQGLFDDAVKEYREAINYKEKLKAHSDNKEEEVRLEERAKGAAKALDDAIVAIGHVSDLPPGTPSEYIMDRFLEYLQKVADVFIITGAFSLQLQVMKFQSKAKSIKDPNRVFKKGLDWLEQAILSVAKYINDEIVNLVNGKNEKTAANVDIAANIVSAPAAPVSAIPAPASPVKDAEALGEALLAVPPSDSPVFDELSGAQDNQDNSLHGKTALPSSTGSGDVVEVSEEAEAKAKAEAEAEAKQAQLWNKRPLQKLSKDAKLADELRAVLNPRSSTISSPAGANPKAPEPKKKAPEPKQEDLFNVYGVTARGDNPEKTGSVKQKQDSQSGKPSPEKSGEPSPDIGFLGAYWELGKGEKEKEEERKAEKIKNRVSNPKKHL